MGEIEAEAAAWLEEGAHATDDIGQLLATADGGPGKSAAQYNHFWMLRKVQRGYACFDAYARISLTVSAQQLLLAVSQLCPMDGEAIEIQVQCLNGEGCTFTLSGSTLGHELRQMVLQRFPLRLGRRFTLHYEDSPLLLHQTLHEQGIVGKKVTLWCTFVPTDLYAAWLYIQGFPVSKGERALEGVTRIEGATSSAYLQHLPRSLETLALGRDFNEMLDGVSLPSSLQSLTFGFGFNQTLEGVRLPNRLQSLTFGYRFNCTLQRVKLPNCLQSLTFGRKFNQTLQGVVFPNSLESLAFGHDFNQTLEGVSLPCGLKSLRFGRQFNQTLEGVCLPSGLQSLEFPREFNQFNQSLERVTLPSGLQCLTFGFYFNKSLEGFKLPTGLQSLAFGDHFDQTLEGVILPSSLKSLTFGRAFNQNLKEMSLPSSLQSLTFGNCFNQTFEGVSLPRSIIESLTFGHNFKQRLETMSLASGITSLKLGDTFNKPLEGVSLPISLQSLTFGHEFSQSLERVIWPSDLKSLKFGHDFNQMLEGVSLPSSLQSLTFGNLFNQRLEKVSLPTGLQSLTFGDLFNQTLKGVVLPSGLQTLTFGHDFNQTLEGVSLPCGLQTLTFGDLFNQPLEGVCLPKNLQSLTFGYEFNQTLEGVNLPACLQSLTFGQEFNQRLEGVNFPSNLQSLAFRGQFNQSLTAVSLPTCLHSLSCGSVGAYYAIALFMTKTEGWPEPAQNPATGWLSSATAAFAGCILSPNHQITSTHRASLDTTNREDLFVVKRQRRLVDLAIFLGPLMLTLAVHLAVIRDNNGRMGLRACDQAIPSWAPWTLALVSCALHMGWIIIILKVSCPLKSRGAGLPMSYRSSIYLDVFGWHSKRFRRANASGMPKAVTVQATPFMSKDRCAAAAFKEAKRISKVLQKFGAPEITSSLVAAGHGPLERPKRLLDIFLLEVFKIRGVMDSYGML
eukprot:s360_g12.t1